jgi:putative glutamine amidotransferase
MVGWLLAFLEAQSMHSAGAKGPRIGVPYRTRNEEVKGDRKKYDLYLNSIREGGGEPVEISFALSSAELQSLARSLDALVLPGSPADVDPSLYKAARRKACNEADAARERTDFALLKHAFAEGKPVLAICYGVQSLNVYLGGTLIQDIPSEIQTKIQHEWSDRKVAEPCHLVRIEPGTRLAQLASSAEAQVNSSHHQAILQQGRSLRVTARAADEIIEAVEWTGDGNWVTGVQWHPERMGGDSLAAALFRELVTAARGAHARS